MANQPLGQGSYSTGPYWVVQASYGPKIGRAATVLETVIDRAPTRADAQTLGNVLGGPFSTYQEAANWLASGSATKAAGQAVSPKPLAGQGTSPSLNPLAGLASIGDFFSRLGQANTWLRVGEVLLGVVLIGVAVARLTGTQNVVSSLVKTELP